MSESTNRLPNSLHSLIDYSLSFTKLSENLSFLCEWNFTNENKIKSLKDLHEIEIARIDGVLKKLPDMEDNLMVCMRGVDEVYKIKDKVNSWGERFLSLEEKYFDVQNAIRQNNETVENKFKIQNDRYETLLNELQQKVNKQISEEVQVVFI